MKDSARRRQPGGRTRSAAWSWRWPEVLLLSAQSGSGQDANHSASKFYPDSSDPAETLAAERGGPCAGRPVGRGDRDLSADHRSVRRQGCQAPRESGQDRPAGRADDFVLFVDLRVYCHRSLAKLPPEAGQFTGTGSTGRPSAGSARGRPVAIPRLLRRVVDVAFCSSWGDDALELLGDLAFQDGRFGEALAMYRKLVLDRPDDTFGLVHPDPTVDLARIAAKKILCRAAAGEKLDVAAEIDAFSRRFPGSSGTLAGRKGPYALIVERIVAAGPLGLPGPA